MVNFGLNSSSIIGILDIFLSFQFFVISYALTEQATRKKVFYIIQTILVPISLFLAGLIFLFQGWRMDPILQLSTLFLHIPIFFLMINQKN